MNKKNSKHVNLVVFIILIMIIWIIYSIIYSEQIIKKDSGDNISIITDIIENEVIISKINEKSSKLEITDYQLIFGRESIMELNCDLIDGVETKQYCIFEQSDINNINITWESVLKQWDEYITTFKCDTLFSEIWKKYCLEHQTILSKSK